MAEQQNRWLGTVLIAPRVSHTVLTLLVALTVAGSASLLVLGQYTSKARIAGWLTPREGLIHIFAPHPGVLTQVHANEGLEVAAGTPLAVLSAEVRSEALGATGGEVVRQLRVRRDSQRAERDRQQVLFAHQAETSAKRLAVIETEQRDVAKEVELQQARLALAERVLARLRDLRDRKIATEPQVQEAEADALDQALALQTLERSRTTLGRERLEVETALGEAPLRQAMALAEIDREIAALEQGLAEAEAQREIVITAPEDGTVTALQAHSGGSVVPDAPLMTMVPAGSTLEARLYGPSRAVGFVQPGQRVLLRYEAFPYQKFGQYSGVVRSVSRTTVGPGEMVGVAAALSELAPDESVYRITVELTSQNATAYGEPVPLRPGMLVKADVLIETRRLYEWVLEPILSLSGGAKA